MKMDILYVVPVEASKYFTQFINVTSCSRCYGSYEDTIKSQTLQERIDLHS